MKTSEDVTARKMAVYWPTLLLLNGINVYPGSKNKGTNACNLLFNGLTGRREKHNFKPELDYLYTKYNDCSTYTYIAYAILHVFRK